MRNFLDICLKCDKVLSNTFHTSTPQGWDCLVEDFLEEINEAAKDYTSNTVIVSEIKEKFGGMRIYVDYHLPDEQILEMEKIVSKYEHLSLKTCTMCGCEDHQMHKRRGYWDIVVCEECYNKRIKDGT